MATQTFSDSELIAFFDRFYAANGKRPTHDDLVHDGFSSGTYRFNRLRAQWATAKGIGLTVPQRPAVYVPTDVKKTAESAKYASCRMPTPEVERGKHGRPIDPPRLSVTEEAVKHYRRAWKGIRATPGA